MKKKKNILIFSLVGFLAVLLCLPVFVFSGKSPNPPAGVGDDELTQGRKQGAIIAVYNPVDESAVAVLRLDGHGYYRELSLFTEEDFTLPEEPEYLEEFYRLAGLSIARITLPDEILDDFGKEGCRAQILHTEVCAKEDPDCDNPIAIFTKDVDNIVFEKRCLDPGQIDCADYVRILNCDVTVSFVCPK